MFRHAIERMAAFTRFDITGVRVGTEPPGRLWNGAAELYTQWIVSDGSGNAPISRSLLYRSSHHFLKASPFLAYFHL